MFGVTWQQAVDILVLKIGSWITGILNALPNFILAIIVFCIAFIIGKILKKVVLHASKKTNNQALARLFGTTVFVAVLIGGLMVALSVLQLQKTVTSLLAGVGIVGIALGFAFQDIAANFISGIIIAVQRPFKTGDLIKTNEYFGSVQHISLRTTELVTLDGLNVVMPNKMVLENPLTNYTKTNDRRVDFEVGVSYAEDLAKVEKITIGALKKVKGRDSKKEPEVLYNKFADSSINFTARLWITDARQTPYLRAQSDAILEIKKAYDKASITIPWPIRTIDFGIKGGVPLSKAMKK